tara:strand:- start:489 stop:1055 length:567 start_codon:yes stop_codon:yes gene_type:complete
MTDIGEHTSVLEFKESGNTHSILLADDTYNRSAIDRLRSQETPSLTVKQINVNSGNAFMFVIEEGNGNSILRYPRTYQWTYRMISAGYRKLNEEEMQGYYNYLDPFTQTVDIDELNNILLFVYKVDGIDEIYCSIFRPPHTSNMTKYKDKTYYTFLVSNPSDIIPLKDTPYYNESMKMLDRLTSMGKF